MTNFFVILLFNRKPFEMKKSILILIIIMIFNTVQGQKNLIVVPAVDLQMYKGTWYEIARKPFSFESKLKCITATYSLRADGKIDVLNKGHLISNPSKIKTAKGKAFIPDKNVPAKLKVQFFWPFRGDYWIMELDKDYKYVMIGEPSFKYLWILARDKKLDQTVMDKLFKKATDAGYDLTNLILTEQNCN
jgi:apolipoprotein D and lipocalin family protein